MNSINSKNEVKIGAILSYILVFLNLIYGFFVLPYIINYFGDSDYGAYKSISSFCSSIGILDFGIGATVLRYTSVFISKKEKGKVSSFLYTALVVASIICILIFLLYFCLFFGVETIYKDTFTQAQLSTARILLIFFFFENIASIFFSLFNNVACGHNKFVFSNSLRIFNLFLKTTFLLLGIFIFRSVIILGVSTLLSTIICFMVNAIYVKKRLGLSPVKTKLDKPLLIDASKYSLLFFIQNISTLANGSIDNIVIGSRVSTVEVTYYSYALLIYQVFDELGTSISSVLLPTMANLLADDNADELVEKKIISVGRVQLIVLGLVLIGFFVFGTSFLNLWIGQERPTRKIWLYAIILMVPTALPLIQNAFLSVIRAKNRIAFRTIALIIMCVVNLAITLVFTPKYGVIAACIGTAVSIFLGNFILMNLYYRFALKMNVNNILRKIYSITWINILITLIFGFGLIRIAPPNNIIIFIIDIVVFSLLYLALQAFLDEDFRKTIVKGRRTLKK